MANVIVTGLALGSVYGLFAVGLNLVWGVLNLLNLAYGALFMLAAFTAYRVSLIASVPFAVLILIGMAVGAASSVIIEVFVFRKLRQKSLNASQAELGMLVASIGLATIPETVVQQVTQNDTEEFPQSVFVPHTYQLTSWLSVTNIQLLMFWLTIVIAVTLMIIVKRTQYGRAIRALAVDQNTAQLLGINANLLSALTMAISGALAGLAGVLLAVYLNVVSATMGDALLLKAFAVIIVGGVGSIGGALIGGFALALAETLVVTYGPANYEDAIAFGLIILFLLFRPNGLFANAKSQRA